MKKIKTMAIITIFLLIGLGLNPIASSNKIIEQTQSNDILLNPSVLEINDINTFSLDEKELDLLRSYILNLLPSEMLSDTTVYEIINFIKNMLDNNPSLIRNKLVISQGWSYTVDLFKNTRFQIKRDPFFFWHYAQASKKGMESKTFVIKPNDMITSKTVEFYRGVQTGLMIRPIGLYFFQKNTFPILSYTLFIGFASYIFINAEEEVILNNPFT